MERSVTILEEKLGREHLSVAEALNRLAHLHEVQGDQCWMNPAAGESEARRHYARAEAYQERALAIQKKLLGSNHSEVAQSLNNLAHIYTALGRSKEAEPLYQQAATVWENAGELERHNLATALKNLAELYDLQRRHAEAELLYRRVLAIGEAIFGPDDPNVGPTLEKLAQIYGAMGREIEAEQARTRSIAVRSRALAIAESLDRKARTLQDQGKPAEAEPLYRQALELREKFLGSDHLDVAQSLNNLATAYEQQRDYHAPEPLVKQSLAIVEKQLGPHHPRVAGILEKMARIHMALGRVSEGKKLLARAQAIRSGH